MLTVYGELPPNELDLVFQTLSLTINNPHLSKYEIAAGVFNSKARENVKILLDFINEAKKAPQFLSITELQQKNFYKVEAYLQKLFSQPTINYFEETIAMIDYSHLGTHLADHQHLLLSEFIPANGNRFDNFDQQSIAISLSD